MKDLFHSKFSRNDLAKMYANTYRAMHGVEPTGYEHLNRAKLVALCEDLADEILTN